MVIPLTSPLLPQPFQNDPIFLSMEKKNVKKRNIKKKYRNIKKKRKKEKKNDKKLNNLNREQNIRQKGTYKQIYGSYQRHTT